jgi:hypothetical protein
MWHLLVAYVRRFKDVPAMKGSLSFQFLHFDRHLKISLRMLSLFIALSGFLYAGNNLVREVFLPSSTLTCIYSPQDVCNLPIQPDSEFHMRIQAVIVYGELSLYSESINIYTNDFGRIISEYQT